MSRWLCRCVAVILSLVPCVTWGQATVSVNAPVGGEVWPAGTVQTIQWSSSAGDNVLIELSRDGGINFDETIFGNTPNDGEQTWTVTGPSTTQARIRVTALGVGGSAASAANFTISEPPFQVTSPIGELDSGLVKIHGETWTARSYFDRERIPVPWRDLVRVYRLWELRGEVRGGRFVQRFAGEQYALPEAIETMRRLRRSQHGVGQGIAVSPADPLNLDGILTPEPRVPSQARRNVEVA